MSEVDGKIWNMCVKMAHSTVEGNIKKDGEGILEEYVLDVCLGCCWLNPTHKAASRKYRFIHFFIYIFTDSKLAKKKNKTQSDFGPYLKTFVQHQSDRDRGVLVHLG